MKNTLIFVSILLIFIIPVKSIACYYDENCDVTDMFSEYIDQNSSSEDSKTTSIHEKEYIFEIYPYINIKYNSKELNDEDKEIKNASEKR
ncbi:MAG TPA: hypothetical protein VNF93_02255 [Buchnera sp. (in: enterobacteria)]|nr:hypothetical protein [Buchnera sp. (in: enterobacteria)]